MDYQQELIDRIKDSDKWPSLERADFLDELDVLAEDSFKKGTIEGYLSALLIYQQLAEEMIRLLLKDHEFYIQLSVFPAEIKFASKEKTMFGRLVEDLKKTITLDESKFEIIDLANQLNQIRIDIVHGLTKIPNLKEIEAKVKQAADLYNELFVKFDDEHDMFRLAFKDFKKDRDWDSELE